ncbi:MAG: hypothetical protein AAF750_14675 [Planctomycetota bacterium]
MTRHAAALSTLLCLTLMLLPACRGTSLNYRPVEPVAAWTDDNQALTRPVGPGLIADPNSPIPDVPMPVGFKGVADQSSAASTPAGRVVTHIYQGIADFPDANDFYANSLWRFGWTQTERLDPAEKVALHTYTNGTETLSITITQDRRRITYRIEIKPASAS